MGKIEDLMRISGNIDESMGAGDSQRIAPATSSAPARWQGVTKAKDVALIPVGKIDRDPDQPRVEFDDEALARLADSLRIRGQLQPIRVRWDEERGVYVILVGERRWRAARVAGLENLACVVVERTIDPNELLAIQLVENALREDLKPVEQARAYRRLMDAHGWSSRQVAEELQIGQASVVRALALLELPAEIQERVDGGKLPASVAYEVSKLEDSGQQIALAEAVAEHGLKRDEVARAVQAVRANRPAPSPRPEPFTVDLGEGVKVRVTWSRASSVTATQALRKALKEAQERERSGRGDEKDEAA
jgi:ParB family transcriptional regulator, chromosome partitioning protein